MNKKFSVGAVIALMAITAAITVSLTYTIAMSVFNERVHSVAERQAMYNKVYEIDQLVRENYLGEIDEEHLRNSLAGGYVQGLDSSYCTYLTAEEYSVLLENQSGVSFGIGIDVDKTDEGNILIYNVTEGSPAETSGIRKGDIITRVGSMSVTSIGYDAAVAELSSASSSKAVFTIRRSGLEMVFEITKSQYDKNTVSYRLINENIGFIQIREFAGNTAKQFDEALNILISQGACAFIFDVRGNSGGQLSAACEVLDILLPAGNIVTSTDKNGISTVEYVSDSSSVDLPMTVIMDHNTASAAELFAAALRDKKSAQLIGETTLGKGTLQKTYALTDGSAVTITVATFAPPVSKSFDQVGVTPDFNVKLEDTDTNFHMLTDEEDNQLQTAIEVISSKISESEVEADEPLDGEGGEISRAGENEAGEAQSTEDEEGTQQ